MSTWRDTLRTTGSSSRTPGTFEETVYIANTVTRYSSSIPDGVGTLLSVSSRTTWVFSGGPTGTGFGSGWTTNETSDWRPTQEGVEDRTSGARSPGKV